MLSPPPSPSRSVLQKGSGDDSQADRKFFEGFEIKYFWDRERASFEGERKYHLDKQTQLRAPQHRPRHR